MRSSRVAGAVVAGTLLLATASCLGSAPSERAHEQPGVSTRARLVPDCPAPPVGGQARSADELNRMMASIDLPAWQSGDIGASARLPDGRIAWIFGDTSRTDAVRPFLVANSMLITSRRCVSQLRTPDDGPVVPDAAPGVVYWPMSMTQGRYDGQDYLVVLCSRIDRGFGGAFGFTYLGSSAAVFTVEDGEAPQLLVVAELTRDSRDLDQVNWGAAATRDGDWYLVYGTRVTGRAYEPGRELYVARTPVATPADRERWQFWDGWRWQPRVERAAPVLAAEDGVSQTLSVDAIDGEYVAVSKRDGDVADYVYTWSAPHPWGPWTAVRRLRAPAGLDTGELRYAPLAHPDIRLASGNLLASISRNTTDLEELRQDPMVGRPEFIELTR